MSLTTALTRRLGITHPVLLAPMDLVADACLTAAVSAAGGLGLLGGGYGEQAWLARELDRLDAAGERFGVGFITWSLAKQPQLLDLVLERKPVAVMLSFGDPAPHIERIRRARALVICQVQSLSMAKAAAAAGAEIIVAQGGEGGGHGAARGLLTLLPEIVDAVGDKALIVAAGGLADGRGLAASLMLGAGGVLLGTRFYATTEAAGAAAAKQRILEVSGDDTLRSIVFDISRRNVWPAPFAGRCLRNPYLDSWYGREVELLRDLEVQAARYAAAREQADFETAAVIAGEAAGLIHDIVPARQLIETMVGQAERLVRLGPTQVETAAPQPAPPSLGDKR